MWDKNALKRFGSVGMVTDSEAPVSSHVMTLTAVFCSRPRVFVMKKNISVLQTLLLSFQSRFLSERVTTKPSKNCLWVNFSLCCDQAIRTPESRRREQLAGFRSWSREITVFSTKQGKTTSRPTLPPSSSSPPHSAAPPPPVVLSGASVDARCRCSALWSKLSELLLARVLVARLNASAVRPPGTRGRQQQERHH